jgi:hypothetical protein
MWAHTSSQASPLCTGKVVRLDPNDLRIIKRKGSNSVEAAHRFLGLFSFAGAGRTLCFRASTKV